MNHGIKPVRKDHRTFSFHRTFGSVPSPRLQVEDFDLDAGFGMPDQNADGLPNGCSGYTQSELCSDEDKIMYDPKFTYEKTLEMDSLEDGEPCDIYTSLSSTIVFGVKIAGEDEKEAIKHKRGAYYQIENSSDWFDSIMEALLQKKSVSFITPWYYCFNKPDGIVGMEFITQPLPNVWHNCKISGKKTINGVTYLKCKPWQGMNFGDKGWCYFSRETINRLMMIGGTGAFTIAEYDPLNIKRIRLGMMQTMVSYCKMIVRKIAKQIKKNL